MQQFSILIPSWNNLAYLQLCVSSIRKNSKFENQIIVYINDGSDGTLEWVKTQHDISFVHSQKNEGICVAMNSCRPLIRAKYLVYMNDDMYVCPDWDLELQKEIENIGHDEFMLSATLIEPFGTTNPNMVSIAQNFGTSLDTFREGDLLKFYKTVHQKNWSGASWPPSVVSTRLWDIVGGYSIEFSPGMYSDPDFSMKLWKYGVRIFKGIGSSKVYHFQSKSTGKVKKNKGADTFVLKWGITANTFYRHYLRMGESAGALPKNIPGMIRLRNKLKRAYKALFA